MAIADRREREKQKLRGKILSTARKIIKEEGYEALTIRKIAARIEYSPMALYGHFADKKAILLALAGEVYAKLEDVFPPPGRDPVAALREGLLLYIDFGLKHTDEYQLVFMTLLPGSSKEYEEEFVKSDTAGLHAFGRLVTYVEACIEKGAINGDPFALATVLWAGIHGVVSLLITQTDFPFGPANIYAERVVDTLLQGLLSHKAPI